MANQEHPAEHIRRVYFPDLVGFFKLVLGLILFFWLFPGTLMWLWIIFCIIAGASNR